MPNKKLHWKNLPTSFPLFKTWVLVTLASYWKFPEWAWTLMIVLIVLLWIGYFVEVFIAETWEIP